VERVKFTLFSVAVKNLRRKSFRTAVLILSIGLLVSILVFGASFIISVSSSLERASNRLGADLLVVPVGARDYAEEMLLETKVKVFYMDKDILGRVSAVEGVEQATHQVYLQSILGLCCDIPAAKIVAFDQDSDFIVKPWLTKVLNRRLEKGEAIIGAEAYENLGLLDVQSSVLFNKKYDFVGVLDKTGTGLDNAIFISEENIDDVLELGSAYLRPDQISLIFTKLEPGYDPVETGRRIEGAILEVDVIERSDMGKRIVSTLTDINRVFMITIILATLLSAFLAWSVFSAIANERLREIGIMRAIGARGSHIVWMFVAEVTLLGVLGSLVGIALGTYLSVSLASFFTLIREMSATMTLFERFEVGFIGLLVGSAICLVGALSSIMRFRRLEPLKALKEA
jgi:putative ABC transport system permease protein